MSSGHLKEMLSAAMMLVCAQVLAACGGPAITPGDYEVQIEYTRDDWPGGEVGKITTATWRIDETEGDYTMEVVGPSFNYKGTEVGQRVVFKKDGADCSTSRVVIDIHPSGEQKFVGFGEIETYMCGQDSLWVTANMNGKLQN